ncbi:MAG: hypothetical protein U0794_03545 [Isosphaeraceae bacterium]
MRRSTIGLLAVALAGMAASRSLAADPPRGPWIGYTEFRTDLPGGRHANVATMRATLIRRDGTERRILVPELAREPGSWTQFAGWSPDGQTAIVGRGWESADNARWEEEHRTFRYVESGWLYDMNLVDPDRGTATNLTAIDRVSFHNTGLFFWPGDPKRLGFQALIDGNSHPFVMDRDGRNKRDLTLGSKEFAYGFNASPDGRRIAYHQGYQLVLADADGSQARRVETGRPFNFAPQWSPDGSLVLFLSGEHYDCHPYLVQADGSGLRKLADRGGYRGVIEFLDVPDFHGGSSDIPVWSPDGAWVFFTSQVGKQVELFRIRREGGTPERLTSSKEGVRHYHPVPSPDGRFVAFGSLDQGVRQLDLMELAHRTTSRLTGLTRGHGAMWPHWQPTAMHD